MIRHLAIAVLALSQLSTARAEPPRVMTDIAPVHSLASIVMQNVGTPDVLLPPGASPHDFALKPSDARNVSQADLIVWIGEDFTPWLERSIEELVKFTPVSGKNRLHSMMETRPDWVLSRQRACLGPAALHFCHHRRECVSGQ